MPEFPQVDLYEELRALLTQIPYGRVATYGGLARALGDLRAARWIGQFLRGPHFLESCAATDHPHDCPCHRVVRLDGDLGGYVGTDTRQKAARLVAENVALRDRQVDLSRHVFDGFEGRSPLAELREFQHGVRDGLRLKPWSHVPRWVGGVDLSYPLAGEAVGAFVMFDRQRDEVAWTAALRDRVRFPYITSYLAFRELPILLQLVERVRAECECFPEVIMVDGSGVAHPRQMGVASMLGILSGHPTVGVTKKMLCGCFDGGQLQSRREAPLRANGRQIGYAVLSDTGGKKPQYVSPGQGTDVEFCRRLFWAVKGQRRSPAPFYWADRISRRVKLAPGEFMKFKDHSMIKP